MVRGELLRACTQICPGGLRGLRVVEYGVGTGRSARWVLSQQPAWYRGLDSCDGALNVCRQRVAQHDQVLLHDVRRAWPVEVSDADVVFGAQVLSHLRPEELQSVFANARAALRQSESAAVVAVERKPDGPEDGDDDDDHSPHSAEDVVAAAMAAGLSLVDTAETDAFIAWRFSPATAEGAATSKA